MFARAIRVSAAALVCGLAVLTAAAPAEAGLKLGQDENLRPLADVRLQNSAKEALYIGHKVTFHWLGLPFSVSDDGYILGVKGKSLYYPLDMERLADWQASGLLPSPLPKYELSLADYVLGHLLWLVLAVYGLWSAGRALMARRSPHPKPLAVAPPPSTQSHARPQPQPMPAPFPARMAQLASAPHGAESALPAGNHPEPPKRACPTAAIPASEGPMATMPAQHREAGRSPPTPQTAGRPEQARPLPTMAQMRAEAAKLPVAKTVCRVKALRAA